MSEISKKDFYKKGPHKPKYFLYCRKCEFKIVNQKQQ